MSYTIEVVSVGIELLMVVAENPGLGVTELAKRSGITKARTFRLLNTLEETGLIRREGPLATYSLGYRALLVGAAAKEQVQLSKLADALLPAVGEACGESVLLRVREAHETICIAWWDAPNMVRVESQLARRRPLHVGASGKLLLAYAPPSVQEEVLQAERESFTSNTITGADQLKQSIQKVREQGYSISYAEKAVDTVSVATPIFDATGSVVASLATTAPASRVSQEKLPLLVAALQQGARQFSQQLGYVAS
ncbi:MULTISPECIES: IclR family transcriptional regulator [unclassified Duganella]|uniref:IclR family transcriptional regulator n=1 Tax=unclassified Duganella TaxID=2636909 RepID=UPI00088CA212|nr:MULTISPECIES: IclR family transcriptional regulator [unclassified Duganella]SDH29006.1 transcriptional regulator, IclR family [Duganella sp. OV458]SDK37904.1 transcriptional regulator, IclR family [Duganella sp. OV510]